jgi:predicted phosphodiesterase
MIGGLALAGLASTARPVARAESEARRSLRIAFLTDSHLPGSPGENTRFARLLDRVQGQKDKPELIVFGGDNVMAVDDDVDKNAIEPIVLVSNAPILTVTGFLESRVERSGGRYVLPSGWMVSEVDKLKELFLRHPHIKLALSGHMHQVDRVDYQGVAYICGGAVSGNLWDAGKYIGFGPAYAMVDLFADGTFRHEVVFWE